MLEVETNYSEIFFCNSIILFKIVTALTAIVIIMILIMIISR